MASPGSPVSPEVVRKIAALARLSVPESEVSVWTEQLGRIVAYIDQLKELPEGDAGRLDDVPPTPLRADEPVSGCGLEALEQNARLLHAHGAVPRIVGTGPTGGGREPRNSASPRGE